jgi:hypothetical protein
MQSFRYSSPLVTQKCRRRRRRRRRLCRSNPCRESTSPLHGADVILLLYFSLMVTSSSRPYLYYFCHGNKRYLYYPSLMDKILAVVDDIKV